jgi:phage-related protein
MIGPSYPTKETIEPRVLRTSFGDGYSQQYPDGINFMLSKFDLTWDALTDDEKKTISNFLKSMGGYKTFVWIAPGDEQKLIKCRSWTFSNIEPSIWSLQATFEEVPI